MIPSPIKRNDFITLDKDSKQLGRILAVSYPNALDDLLEKYSLDEGDAIHLLICGLAAVGRVEDAQDAYWYLHDMARSGKGKSMRESRGQGETNVERKLRMIESKLNRLAEDISIEDDENTKKKYEVINEPPYCSATVLTTTDDYDEAVELIKKYAKKYSGVYKVRDAETGKKLAEEWNDRTWYDISHDMS